MREKKQIKNKNKKREFDLCCMWISKWLDMDICSLSVSATKQFMFEYLNANQYIQYIYCLFFQIMDINSAQLLMANKFEFNMITNVFGLR